MLNKNYFFFIIIFLLFAVFSNYAQQRDKYGNINIKGLTQADMERLFPEYNRKFYKTNGETKAIKSVIISGNKITTILYNYGSICKPNTLPNIADLVWQGLGYGFEFGPLAAGEVSGGGIDTLHIVDDSFVLSGQGSYSPDGTLKWGWLPKPGYADPNQDDIATLNAPDLNGDGKPDSWPESFYSAGAGKYIWPAFLGDQATAPDEEVYYVMDDYTNAEFPYYPFPSDTTKRGLGLDAEVRVLQFNNPLAQNILFLVYRITNASEKSLPRLYFGMQGDPHVGGSADYGDDNAFFIPATGDLATPYPQRSRSMVYAYDADGVGLGGRKTGYFGWKFLESPSNSTDGIDNDDDGMLDESPFNSAGNYVDGVNIPLTYGISDLAKFKAIYGDPKPRYQGDEDGDWNPAKDDIGIDGIGPDSPNYPGPDFGEGDGVPTQGWYQDVNDNNKFDAGEPISTERIPGYKWAGSEPSFGLRDISESDQLGLTSFHAAAYTNSLPNVPKNTPLMWEWLSSAVIDPNQTLLQNPGDNIFNFGTGPLSLERGETQRFSMAILFGDNLTDLVLNAETSTRVLEADYRFAQPPLKPIVTAVPGNNQVTLYWDSRAEGSIDPLSSKKDFQGYKIYRSRDYQFSDVYKITDGNGVPFLGQPLLDANGNKAQFDYVDSLSGYFPVEYSGRAVKYYIGNNTGLVHEYVDKTAKNGITYYYAVVSYDGGNLETGKELAPSECQAVIKKDAVTSELKYDVNTVGVTPGPLPSGIENAAAGINGIPQTLNGNSTGAIKVKVLNDLIVEPKQFKINFTDSVAYNILDSTGVSESITSKDTVFVNVSNGDIEPGSFQLFDASNTLVDASKYFINTESGKLRGLTHNALPEGEIFTAKYRYYPVLNSQFIRGQDDNPAFNGVKVYVTNDPLGIDTVNSGFITNTKIDLKTTLITKAEIGTSVLVRADWEIRWNNVDTTANGDWAEPGDTASNHLGKPTVCPFRIFDVTNGQEIPAKYLIFEKNIATRNQRWDWGEAIVLRASDATGNQTAYEIKFELPSASSAQILPKAGDVYKFLTTKPFQSGDTYLFNTEAVKFDNQAADTSLNNIFVVPNPYVAYSPSENPGRNPDQRGDRDLQFRNLPPKCTIRIYTLVGELVKTIEKDDMTSIAHWDLLSFESQRIAYGIYIYHVDAPGIGEKIGRIAIIK